MKKYLLGLMLLLGLGATSVSALAVPFVVQGSSYSFYLQDSQDESRVAFGTVIFDGDDEMVSYDTLRLIVSERETALRNGQSQITFTLMASDPFNTGETLFSAADSLAVFGIGVDGDGFDLLGSPALKNATLNFLDASGAVLATLDNVAEYVANPVPWDGVFTEVGSLAGFGEETIDARLIAGISIDFLVGENTTAVPEPGSLLLSGIGLLAAVLATRRRRA